MTLKKSLRRRGKRRLSSIEMNNTISKSISKNNHNNIKFKKQFKNRFSSADQENQEVSNNFLVAKSSNYILNRINKIDIKRKYNEPKSSSLNKNQNETFDLKYRNINKVYKYNENKKT